MTTSPKPPVTGELAKKLRRYAEAVDRREDRQVTTANLLDDAADALDAAERRIAEMRAELLGTKARLDGTVSAIPIIAASQTRPLEQQLATMTARMREAFDLLDREDGRDSGIVDQAVDLLKAALASDETKTGG